MKGTTRSALNRKDILETILDVESVATSANVLHDELWDGEWDYLSDYLRNEMYLSEEC